MTLLSTIALANSTAATPSLLSDTSFWLLIVEIVVAAGILGGVYQTFLCVGRTNARAESEPTMRRRS